MTWPGDPFLRVTPVAAEGNGPNALLQNNPFMGLHPPLLYLGYTGLAVPFAFGVAALIARRTDEEWLAVVRRWTLVPWIFLTAGIVAGAWWSYEVLGWGGYWAWDPVENAALLPWLTATAFIHSSMVAERRGTLRTWTHALVIATFVLTLVGTFLTRSGVVVSVHSFTASAIGPWFAGAILLTLAGALGLLVWRLPELRDTRPPGAVVSRETAFLANNLLFLTITFAVLFGTLYPLIVEATSGARASVGTPWFNRVNAPIFVALLFLTGVGPALPWGGASWATIRERFALPILAGVAATVAALALGLRDAAPIGTLGLAAFVLVVMGEEVVRGARVRGRSRGEAGPVAVWHLATRNRRRYGGYLVHAGICVMAVSIAVSATLGIETTAALVPGGQVRAGRLHAHLQPVGHRAPRVRRPGGRDAGRADGGRASIRPVGHRPARLPELQHGDRHARGDDWSRRGPVRHPARVRPRDRVDHPARLRQPAGRLDLARRRHRDGRCDLRHLARSAPPAGAGAG